MYKILLMLSFLLAGFISGAQNPDNVIHTIKGRVLN
jgi:hypothetical protein